MSLLVKEARVVTQAPGVGARRGPSMGELLVHPATDVRVEGGCIVAVGRGLPADGAEEVIEARGRVLLPGFVDCHTHACWTGDRLDEWERKRRGVPYLEILAGGGGILATVRAVRSATGEALAAELRGRLDRLLAGGTTTVEVKSGYGLSTDAELKLLRAIREASIDWPGSVVPTALLGHAKDPSIDDFVELTVRETLPAVTREFPRAAVDAYCEEGSWSTSECVRLLAAATAAGHPVRVHADQFHALGMTREAVRLGAVSVDHLEASSKDDLEFLAASRTLGVILPVTGFHTDGRFANGRALIDAGGAVALATNWNPGTAPSGSMPFAIALAVRQCGLTPAEAITASTLNAAAVLGLSDRGVIAPGARADLVLLHHRDERMLAYEVGSDPVAAVVCGGMRVK
ncbi:MAG TPA: imidazolonepropionase [Opitutaceae bacterium]